MRDAQRRLARSTAASRARSGVSVRTGTVESVEGNKAVVWLAGVKCEPMLYLSGLPIVAGKRVRIEIEDNLPLIVGVL